MNISELIPEIPIFCTLDPEEVKILKQHIEKKVYNENEAIFAENDPGDGLYIIAIGGVKIVKSLDATHDKALAGFAEKEFFGEMALLDGKARSAAAVAVRKCVILKVSIENFNALMNEAPFTAMKIITQIACHLAIRLRVTNTKLAELENYRLLRSS